MFAPPMKAPQAKTASEASPSCAYKPQQRTSLWPEAGLSHQAVLRSLRFGDPHAARPAESTSANHATQGTDLDRVASGQGAQGTAWDFSMVPVFARDLPSRSEPPSSILRWKVAIGPVNDPLEQEADRVADQALRMPVSPTVVLTAAQQVSRKCAQSEDEHDVQPNRADPARGLVGALVRQVLNSPGRPLDAATRAYFEPRFKYDFSAVRIHSDAQATEAARQVNSLAYTVGTNVVFRSDTYSPDTPVGKRLLAHELAHVVQQRRATSNLPLSLGRTGDLAEQEAELAANRAMSGRQAALRHGTDSAAHVVRRSPGPRTPPTPSPPAWLGPLRARATHVQGDIWDVQIASLGRSPVGPHDQMQAYLRVFNQNRPPNVEAMQSAHIIGGEHIRDLGWNMPYNKAPCIGVAASLHDKWTREISNLQSQQGPMGGRTTATAGRPIVSPADVKALHHEVYRGIPELQNISRRIVDLEARRIMGTKYGMPKPTSRMEAHQGGMPKPTKSPMEAHQGGMPKPTKSPMDVHQGGMPKPTKSPMEVHQGGMPKPTGVPKPEGGFGTRLGGGWRIARGIGGAVGQTAVLLVLAYFGAKGKEYFENKRIKMDLEQLLPEIQTAMNRREGEVEMLLQQTHMRQTIYANIQVEVTYSFMIDPDGPPMIDYQNSKFIGVDVSTQNINREDLIREQMGISGHDDHHRHTYSVPIAAPAALVLPAIRIVHELLTAIRTDLRAVGGGTAGEAVALDHLNVAQQATDVTGPSVSPNNTAAERFHLTVDAITTSLSVLEGLSGKNPPIRGLTGRLRVVKSIVDGLGSQWVAMVE